MTLGKELQASSFAGVLSNVQVAYAAADAAVLLPLASDLSAGLRRLHLARVAALEFGAVPAVADMEQAGFYLDLDLWGRLGDELDAERSRLRDRLASRLLVQGPNASFLASAGEPQLAAAG